MTTKVSDCWYDLEDEGKDTCKTVSYYSDNCDGPSTE